MTARLTKKQSRIHSIPIWDCPNCGKKDQPLSTKGPYVNPRFPGKEIYVSSCPECDIVLEDESQIKGYASHRWMKEHGWKTEKQA